MYLLLLVYITLCLVKVESLKYTFLKNKEKTEFKVSLNRQNKCKIMNKNKWNAAQTGGSLNQNLNKLSFSADLMVSESLFQICGA